MRFLSVKIILLLFLCVPLFPSDVLSLSPPKLFIFNAGLKASYAHIFYKNPQVSEERVDTIKSFLRKTSPRVGVLFNFLFPFDNVYLGFETGSMVYAVIMEINSERKTLFFLDFPFLAAMRLYIHKIILQPAIGFYWGTPVNRATPYTGFALDVSFKLAWNLKNIYPFLQMHYLYNHSHYIRWGLGFLIDFTLLGKKQ